MFICGLFFSFFCFVLLFSSLFLVLQFVVELSGFVEECDIFEVIT